MFWSEHDRQWTHELKEDFETCLQSVESSGSFAHFEVLKDYVPNPGIHIKDVGPISLPLSERDAKAIVSASHQAPFGKGTETIVDLSVRKTWELSPTEFSLTNVAWKGLMASVGRKIHKELGMKERGVRAELYKLLLYEEGAMFKPHQDPEKCPGMFGTLVIALPSKHEGGDIHATHAGRTRLFQTSRSSEFDFSFLVWYSDVVHEVKPIVSGRRLVLTYNLIRTAQGIPRPAAIFNADILELKQIFSRWKSGLEDQNDKKAPKTLAYLFEHQHTNASLSYDALRGHDYKVASHLKEACEKVGFYFCLANCERRIVGGCDEEDSSFGGHHLISTDLPGEMELQHVAELDGTQISKDLMYDEDLIIQTDPFENEDPDDEDYQVYTGNEGSETTHFYRRTIGIIMPASHRIPFFLQSTGYRYGTGGVDARISLWIDHSIKVIAMNPDSDAAQKARDELEEICTMVISGTRSWKSGQKRTKFESEPYSPESLGSVFAATIELNKHAQSIEVLELCQGRLPIPRYNHLGVMMRRHHKNDELYQLVTTELQSLGSFAQRYEAILNLSKGFLRENGDNPVCLTPEFFHSQLRLAMSEMNLTSAADGTALARRVEVEVGEPKELIDIISRAVRKNMQSMPMAVAFLVEIMSSAPKGKSLESDAYTVFKDLIKDLSKNFRLNTIPPFNEIASSWYDGFYGVYGPVETAARKTGENIAALLRHCLLLNMEDELSQILLQVTTQTQSIHVNAFHCLLLPLLKHLVVISKEDDLSPFSNLFQAILSEYVVRYVQVKPQPTKEHRAEKKVWQKRAAIGEQRIKDIAPEALMRVLLKNLFEQIWSLDTRGLAVHRTSPSSPSPLGIAQASHVNQAAEPLLPITNRKRPAVMDLTKESD